LTSEKFRDRFFDKRIEDLGSCCMAAYHVFRLRLDQVRMLVLAAWDREQRHETKEES
jgi:hypothetical protein